MRADSPTERIDFFGEIDGRKRIQRGWLAEEMLVQFKLCPSAITLYKKKHCRPGIRRWVKVTPLGKQDNTETAEDVSQEISEESLDIQDARSRLGGWPIVEAAVSDVKIKFLANMLRFHCCRLISIFILTSVFFKKLHRWV